MNRSIDVGTFTKLYQLGKAGKEGVTFLVKDVRTNERYAMKTFKPKKSAKTLQKEAEHQAAAAEVGAAPFVLGFNSREKVIVMQKMDETADQCIREDRFSDDDQHEILELLRRLDRARIIHHDLSSANFMRGGDGRWYIIDFGMVKTFDQVLRAKKAGSGWNDPGGPSNASPTHVAVMLRLWQRISKLSDAEAGRKLRVFVEHGMKQNKLPVAGQQPKRELPDWLQQKLARERSL